MDEEKIFQGNTPAKSRIFLSQALATLYGPSRILVIPCCGQLAIAKVAVKAGWKPEQIRASDVSLFSTILGYYITGQPLGQLNIRIWGESVKDYVEALYGIKLAMLRAQARHYYQDLQIIDLVKRKEAHLEALRTSLSQFDYLRGMEYQVKDLFDELHEALEGDCIIWLNPPGYFRGYAKMYSFGDAIEWDEPQYTEFKPNEDHNRIRDLANGKRATLLWHRYKAIEPEDEPFAVFCEHKGKNRWDYTLCNHPDLVKSGISDKVTKQQSYHWKVLPAEHEIISSSTVTFQGVLKDEGLYYRDLFIHRLGVTQAQVYYLLIVDGYVAGTVGVMAKQNYKMLLTSPFEGDVEEYYGMTAHSSRHPKLNRLLMMLIKSNEFLSHHDTLQFWATGIATTCLSQYPELKINRGIYKLLERVKMKDGSYKLRYRADRTPQSYQEVLLEWLKKYS